MQGAQAADKDLLCPTQRKGRVRVKIMQGKFTSSATVSERQIPVQMYRYRYEDVAEGLKYAGTTVPVQHSALPYSAEAIRSVR